MNTSDSTVPTAVEDTHPASRASPRRRRAYAAAAAAFVHGRRAPDASTTRALRALFRRIALSGEDAQEVLAARGRYPSQVNDQLYLVADAGLGPALIRDLVRLAWVASRYHPRERNQVRNFATMMLLDESMVACIEAEMLPEADEPLDDEPDDEVTPAGTWLTRLVRGR